MEKIKFSIIMPFYNSIEYIEGAILSVVNQTYKNWELIAVNDGSSDKSETLVKKYASQDSRIRLINKKNGGYSTAINCGLDNLSKDSDYFLMLGSDDRLFLNIFGEIIIRNKMVGYNPDIIGFITTIIKGETVTISKDTLFDKDTFVKNATIVDFYKSNRNYGRLFLGRDTSRCYKTKLLGDLRYFGNIGLAADGIFSILFSYQCKSFSSYNAYGYIWNVRENSVSSVKLTDLKISEVMNNWHNFFTVFLRKKYKPVDVISKKYLNEFYKTYLYLYTRSGSKSKYDFIGIRKTIRNFCFLFGLKKSKYFWFTIFFPRMHRLIFKTILKKSFYPDI